jgi:hypothetical protein
MTRRRCPRIGLTRAAPRAQAKPGCCYYLSPACRNSTCFDHHHQALHSLGYRFRSAAADELRMQGIQDCFAPYRPQDCPRRALASDQAPFASGQFVSLQDGASLSNAHPVLSNSLVQMVAASSRLTDSSVTLAQNSWLESVNSTLALDR